MRLKNKTLKETCLLNFLLFSSPLPWSIIHVSDSPPGVLAIDLSSSNHPYPGTSSLIFGTSCFYVMLRLLPFSFYVESPTRHIGWGATNTWLWPYWSNALRGFSPGVPKRFRRPSALSWKSWPFHRPPPSMYWINK